MRLPGITTVVWVLIAGCTAGCTAGPDVGTGGMSDMLQSEEGNTCSAGKSVDCACLGGELGYQVCRPDGKGYGACQGCPGMNALDGGDPWAVDGGNTSGSPCGECDGCCDGTSCVPFASQTTGSCGPKGADCAPCAGATICGPGGQCVSNSGCDVSNCADGCCQADACIKQSPYACGTGAGSCVKCEIGVTCNGSCTKILDDNYPFNIAITSVVVEQTNPDGDAWDAFGGDPDPYVCMSYVDMGGKTKRGCTDDCSGVFTCDYSKTPAGQKPSGLLKDSNGNAVLFPGWVLKQPNKLHIEVYDYDLTSADDLIAAGNYPGEQMKLVLYQTGAFGSAINVYWSLK